MSIIRPGDAKLHYSDNSHRWMCPIPDVIDEDVWSGLVHAHMEAHRAFEDERPHTRRRAERGRAAHAGSQLDTPD